MAHHICTKNDVVRFKVDEGHRVVILHCMQDETPTVSAFCALCSTPNRLWHLGTATSESDRAWHQKVQWHISSPHHIALAEEQRLLLCVEESLPIELNGISMLLDHHMVFPNAMFGEGRQLYDMTVGAVKVPDHIGAVYLQPYHRYCVVQITPAMEADVRPKTVPPSMRFFALQRRARRKGAVKELNRQVRVEMTHRKIRNAKMAQWLAKQKSK